MRNTQVYVSNKTNKDKDNKKPEDNNINIKSYPVSTRNEKKDDNVINKRNVEIQKEKEIKKEEINTNKRNIEIPKVKENKKEEINNPDIEKNKNKNNINNYKEIQESQRRTLIISKKDMNILD